MELASLVKFSPIELAFENRSLKSTKLGWIKLIQLRWSNLHSDHVLERKATVLGDGSPSGSTEEDSPEAERLRVARNWFDMMTFLKGSHQTVEVFSFAFARK